MCECFFGHVNKPGKNYILERLLACRVGTCVDKQETVDKTKGKRRTRHDNRPARYYPFNFSVIRTVTAPDCGVAWSLQEGENTRI